MYAGRLQAVYDGGAISIQETRATEQPVERRAGRATGSAEGKAELDRYFPSGDTVSGLRLDDVNAIRSGSDRVNQHNCYCGNCSICRSKASDESAAAKSPVSQERPDDALKTEATALSEEEKREVAELTQRDAEVRAHEQAHAAAGAGNVTYSFQTGPDGRQYAIGGSADMQVSAPSGNADAKAEQARRLRTAALAPADPSPQDYAVAAKADQILAEARQEKAEEEADQINEDDETLTGPDAGTHMDRGSNKTAARIGEPSVEAALGTALNPTPEA